MLTEGSKALWEEMLDLQLDERPNNRDILATLSQDAIEFCQYAFNYAVNNEPVL